MRAVQRTGLAVEWGGQGLRGAPAVPLVCGGGRPPPTGSGRPVHHKHHASPIVRVRSSQRWRLRWRGSAIPTRGGSGLAAAAPRTTARGRPPPARPDTIPRGRSRAAVNTDGLALRGAVAHAPLKCLALHCGPLGGRHLCGASNPTRRAARASGVRRDGPPAGGVWGGRGGGASTGPIRPPGPRTRPSGVLCWPGRPPANHRRWLSLPRSVRARRVYAAWWWACVLRATAEGVVGDGAAATAAVALSGGFGRWRSPALPRSGGCSRHGRRQGRPVPP